MHTLLDSVIQAHGGTNIWDGFTDLVTDVDLSGQLFEQAGWSVMLPQSRLLLSLRGQHAIFLLPEGRGQILLKPDQLTHFDADRKEVESMSSSSAHVSQLEQGFMRDSLPAAFFLFNVVRRSTTAPFLYASSGFVTEEIEPWRENGEVWRVLKVTFPSGDDLPSRVQFAYYGPDGLLRRLRNKVPSLGGLDLVEYVSSYNDVEGVQIPLLRHVFACDPDGRKIGDQPLGRIEFRDVILTA